MDVEINKKQNPQGGILGGRTKSAGRGLGTQVWALHPTVGGSIPLRSAIKYTNFEEGCQWIF